MEDKNPSLGRITFIYGLLLALAMIVFSLILFILDLDQNKYIQFISYVILLVGIIWSQIHFRDKYSGGFLNYGRSFSVGFLTALFAAIVMSIYAYVYFAYIDPGALQDAMIRAEEEMLSRGLEDMEVEQALIWAEKMQKPWIYAMWALLGNVLIGVIMALITAVFTKREGEPAETEL